MLTTVIGHRRIRPRQRQWRLVDRCWRIRHTQCIGNLVIAGQLPLASIFQRQRTQIVTVVGADILAVVRRCTESQLFTAHTSNRHRRIALPARAVIGFLNIAQSDVGLTDIYRQITDQLIVALGTARQTIAL